MRLLRPAAVYFALVFGTGFVLGTVRVLRVVPRVGTRTAELVETPVMIAASVLTARWTNRRFAADAGPWARLRIGLLALALLLAAEVALGVVLRGASPAEVLVNRDPVAGTAYYLALVVFAILP